jgi:hypothetical protein
MENDITFFMLFKCRFDCNYTGELNVCPKCHKDTKLIYETSKERFKLESLHVDFMNSEKRAILDIGQEYDKLVELEAVKRIGKMVYKQDHKLWKEVQFNVLSYGGLSWDKYQELVLK